MCYDCEAAAGVAMGSQWCEREPTLTNAVAAAVRVLSTKAIVMSHHVKAHEGHPYNELSDKLCTTMGIEGEDWEARLGHNNTDEQVMKMITRNQGSIAQWLYLYGTSWQILDGYPITPEGNIGPVVPQRESIMVIDPNVIGEHLDGYREADVEHSWEASDMPYGTTLKIASINAQTLKKRTKRKLYQKQMSERNFAIVMIQESRAKTTGIAIENEYIVITAAADEKGSYGCEIWVNMNTVMVKWWRRGEEKSQTTT